MSKNARLRAWFESVRRGTGAWQAAREGGCHPGHRCVIAQRPDPRARLELGLLPSPSPAASPSEKDEKKNLAEARHAGCRGRF